MLKIYFPKGFLKEKETSLDKKKDKLDEFRGLKDRLAFLKGRGDKTQSEFDKYIRLLFDDELCKHMTGIKDIISLCNNNLFDCKFRSRDNFNFRGKLKFECLREKEIKLRKLL